MQKAVWGAETQKVPVLNRSKEMFLFRKIGSGYTKTSTCKLHPFIPKRAKSLSGDSWVTNARCSIITQGTCCSNCCANLPARNILPAKYWHTCSWFLCGDSWQRRMHSESLRLALIGREGLGPQEWTEGTNWPPYNKPHLMNTDWT
jgi:hypothetical protein